MANKELGQVLRRFVQKYLAIVLPGLIFALGMWLLVWRPIGYRFSIIPGLYGDTRLINYILEHFYRWVSGLEASFWDAGLYYPFPLTLAFSDNLLGAGPFYALLRLAGLNRESALQGWLMLGFALNFAAAAWVLRRLKFSPFSAGLGAFFFAFGLPMLAQVIHAQMLYRFCIPLAAFLLWRFGEQPRLARLAGAAVLLLWQALTGIYLGVFLGMLLATQAAAMAAVQPGGLRAKLRFWPDLLRRAWQGEPGRLFSRSIIFERLLALAALALLAGGLAALFAPYLEVTRLYGFKRNWEEVLSMLPYPQSYLVADRVVYWQGISRLAQGTRMRHEHQLFFGLTALALLGMGSWGALARRFSEGARCLALANLGVLLGLVLLTLQVGGFTLYRLVWFLPGMDSIRSVTRMALVLMWPAAVVMAYGADGLLDRAGQWGAARRWMAAPAAWGPGLNRLFALLPAVALAGLLLAGMLFESFSFEHRQKFAKRHAQERVAELRALLPADIPQDPILFAGVRGEDHEEMAEIDGMLLAQELGWPTLNGYSGNEPPGYGKPTTCRELPNRIAQYLQFTGIDDPASYRALMGRVVPVGFTDCDPRWWEERP